MPPDMMRAAPSTGAARCDQSPTKSTDPRSHVTVAGEMAPVVDLAAYREFRAWVAAVVWLNAKGCAAAVPAALTCALTGQGLAVWASTSTDAESA